jgi:glycosyltransferase involved in cell wall biosynthesis
MDVLHVVQGYFPARGGTEFLFQQVSERLVRQHGDNVTVYTTYGYNTGFFVDASQPAIPHCDDEVVNGVTIRRFPVNRTLAPRIARLQHVAYVREWPLNDVVRTLYHGPISRPMLRAILGARADVIVASSFPLLHMYYAALGRRLNQVPLLFHGALHPGDRQDFGRPIIYKAIAACDMYLANTEYERDHVVAKGFPAERVRIASPGVDPVPFEAADGRAYRRQLGWENVPVVAYVGQQAAHKGIDDLYSAMRLVWRQLPEARLIVAGARTPFSPQLDTVLDAFTASERDRICVIGDFTDDEKPEIYAACDVFVSASGHESFGITFLEAWAAGKPVVGCRSGAVPTVIDEWRDGLLVPYRAPAQLASALLELLLDDEAREEMGRRGREKVLAHHTWDVAVKRFRDAYEEAAVTRSGIRAPGQT